MKSIVVLICAVSAAAAFSFTSVVHEEWMTFKLEHQKQYETEQEDAQRMKIYAENKQKIAKHNQLFARGLVTYSLKLNKYSDLTHHEFLSTVLGYNGTEKNTASFMKNKKHVAHFVSSTYFDAPAQKDWRKLGAVTDVKDQGNCGAGWAFSATGALEGQHFLQTGVLESLSEQNLIDCSRKNGNLGCKGGQANKAFTYIKMNEGIDTAESYPYEGADGSCRFNPSDVGAVLTGFKIIPKNEQKLLEAVANVGPVSAAMYASLETFRHYEKGVYNDDRCTDVRPRNHGVLIVGYGKDETNGDYWLVKNSWGTSWGLQGFAMVARKGNLCGLASDASYPVV